MQNNYEYNDGGRSKYFRMKYKSDNIGDCVVRALAIATGDDYQLVRRELWDTSFQLGDMPSSKPIYEAFLEKRGFIKEKKIKGFNLGNYPKSQKEIYVAVLANHLVCVEQGVVKDIWDCRKKYPYAIWIKPN